MTGTYAVIDISLLAFAILHPGTLGAYALGATSFFMSVTFPTIFALGIKGLGANTKLEGRSLMAIVVAGVLPPLMGLIAKSTGSYALGFTVAVVGYVVVALYGFPARRD
jgi:MFS transporter, FHS family, L-fucose permease